MVLLPADGLPSGIHDTCGRKVVLLPADGLPSGIHDACGRKVILLPVNGLPSDYIFSVGAAVMLFPVGCSVKPFFVNIRKVIVKFFKPLISEAVICHGRILAFYDSRRADRPDPVRNIDRIQSRAAAERILSDLTDVRAEFYGAKIFTAIERIISYLFRPSAQKIHFMKRCTSTKCFGVNDPQGRAVPKRQCFEAGTIHERARAKRI